MSAGGDGDASANVGSSAGQGAQVYHRGETPTGQTPAVARQQEQTREIWGQPAYGSNIPSVKAYIGPLPAGWRGVEFSTPVRPNPRHCTPWEARWYHGFTSGVTLNSNGFAVIPVSWFRNMQP
jgi:hypothetical protein